MKDKLLLALEKGIAYYPCSGFDFEMINTIHKFQPRTKNFIYCNSENADGWSLNTEEFIPQIERNGFQYEEFETMLIEEIHPIGCIYNRLNNLYGVEFRNYSESIKNTVTQYLLTYEKQNYNLFYFRAEALTLFYWLNDLNSNSIKKGNNTLIIKAPNGQWIGTEEFIKLLHEQAQLFNTTAIYNGFKELPYQLVNQN
jgi:hypothetical protein